MEASPPGTMARIVQLKDQTPLLIKPEDCHNGVVAVCRCGLSSNWPYCNGTHKATIGEEPDKLYHYDRTLPQGAVKRHEVDPGLIDGSTDEGPKASQSRREHEGHGQGATPVRPPRPPGRPEAEAVHGGRDGEASPVA